MYRSVYRSTHLSIYLYMHACMHACMHTCLHTYANTHVHMRPYMTRLNLCFPVIPVQCTILHSCHECRIDLSQGPETQEMQPSHPTLRAFLRNPWRTVPEAAGRVLSGFGARRCRASARNLTGRLQSLRVQSFRLDLILGS